MTSSPTDMWTTFSMSPPHRTCASIQLIQRARHRRHTLYRRDERSSNPRKCPGALDRHRLRSQHHQLRRGAGSPQGRKTDLGILRKERPLSPHHPAAGRSCDHLPGEEGCTRATHPRSEATEAQQPFVFTSARVTDLDPEYAIKAVRNVMDFQADLGNEPHVAKNGGERAFSRKGLTRSISNASRAIPRPSARSLLGSEVRPRRCTQGVQNAREARGAEMGKLHVSDTFAITERRRPRRGRRGLLLLPRLGSNQRPFD